MESNKTEARSIRNSLVTFTLTWSGGGGGRRGGGHDLHACKDLVTPVPEEVRSASLRVSACVDLLGRRQMDFYKLTNCSAVWLEWAAEALTHCLDFQARITVSEIRWGGRLAAEESSWER